MALRVYLLFNKSWGGGKGVYIWYVYMCESGASFLCVHKKPVSRLHLPATHYLHMDEVQRRSLSYTPLLLLFGFILHFK